MRHKIEYSGSIYNIHIRLKPSRIHKNPPVNKPWAGRITSNFYCTSTNVVSIFRSEY
jgi:hypothetical protein